MPLKAGTSDKTVSKNIKELIKTGKEKGHIGTGPEKSGAALQKQAIAIALNKKRESMSARTVSIGGRRTTIVRHGR